MATIHGLKVFLQSIIYITLVFLLLHEINETTAIEECTGFDAPANMLKRSDYDFLIRHSTSEERSNRRVVKVVLSSTIEPDDVISNLCTQREFTARVIDRLNQLGAAVMALEIKFTCVRGALMRIPVLGTYRVRFDGAALKSHAVSTRK